MIPYPYHHHEHDSAYSQVYNEDPFKLTIELDSPDLVGVPFKFAYYTVPMKPMADCDCLPPKKGQKSFTGYWNSNEDYNHIRKVDSNTFLVPFPANHRIGEGYLILEMKYKLADTEYEGGYVEHTRRYNTFVYVSTEHNTDDEDYDITTEVFLKCFRGPSGTANMSFETINGKPILKIGTQQFELTPYIYIVSTVYADPVISLSYSDIAAAGGSVSPRISYSQKKTITYSDGSTKEETIGGGGTLAYSSTNSLVNSTSGAVVATSSTNTTRHKVDTVTVSVTLNGKTATKSADVYQTAYVAPNVSYDYYIGGIQSTASAFSALTKDQLLAAATKKSINATATTNHQATKSCIFLLVPTSHSHLTLSKFQYTSGGMTTNILSEEAWNLSHADVEIDGTTYKVYGYRSGGITESDPLTFDYQITYAK